MLWEHYILELAVDNQACMCPACFAGTASCGVIVIDQHAAVVRAQAFDALRVLAEQHDMAQSSSAATTNGVFVEITTAFVGSKIPLDLLALETPASRPVWTYRCRVENVGCAAPVGGRAHASRCSLGDACGAHTPEDLQLAACWRLVHVHVVWRAALLCSKQVPGRGAARTCWDFHGF